MSFHPIGFYSIQPISEVLGLSLLYKLDASQPYLLATGGAKPMVVHVGKDHFGVAYEAAQARREEYIVAGDLEILIDPTTRAQYGFSNRYPGHLVHDAKGIGLVVQRRTSQGFMDQIVVYIDDPNPMKGPTGDGVHYGSWKLCKRDGEKRIELLDVDVKEPS